MPKISKAIIDSNLRSAVFADLGIASIESFHKINERQYGCILIDDNGDERYIRLGAIVAELRDDITARELMQSEIDKYEATQAKKNAAAEKKRKKIEADKAKQEKKDEDDSNQYLTREVTV